MTTTLPAPRRRPTPLAAWSCGLCASITAMAGASTLHVDDDAGPGGDGTTWQTAFAHLSDALAAADLDPGVDTIRVAAGIHRADESAVTPEGTGDRTARFVVAPGLTLIGGHAGAADPGLRDPARFPTILCGDLADNDTDDPTSREDNTIRLIDLEAGFDAAVVLDGFTVRRADGHAAGRDFASAAIRASGPRVVIRTCLIEDNRTPGISGDGVFGRGGGVWSSAERLVVEDSVIQDNHAESGGGIFADGVIELSGCTIRRNRCTGFVAGGGGVELFDGRGAIITGSRFEDNLADVGGGFRAVRCLGAVRISDSSFTGNQTNSGAAGFSVDNNAVAPEDRIVEILRVEVSDNATANFVAGGLVVVPEDGLIRLRDIAFRRNVAGLSGGGLGVAAATPGGGFELDMANCIFDRNVAEAFSGMAIGNASTGGIVNCTFSGNLGSVASPDGIPIRNCIFWGNDGPVFIDSLGDPIEDPGLVDISHSIIEGGWAGDGNLDADPRFVQPGTGNLRLTAESPALDAGSLTLVPADLRTDIDGLPRIQGAAIDMGAHEGVFDALPPIIAFPDIDPGQPVIAGLDGGLFAPVSAPSFIFINESDLESAELLISTFDPGNDPPAPGGIPVDIAHRLTSDVPDGELRLLVLMPFDAEDVTAIGGPDADPRRMNLARRDEATGAWALAASANTALVPGVGTPLADRTVAIDTPGIGFVNSPGRWGVWWDQIEQRGVVWATTDRTGDYAVVFGTCAGDLAQPPDGTTGLADLLEVLASWDRGAGPWDVDGDGDVDLSDLTELLAAWGSCP
jgi:hypothetical protein